MSKIPEYGITKTKTSLEWMVLQRIMFDAKATRCSFMHIYILYVDKSIQIVLFLQTIWLASKMKLLTMIENV